MSVSASDWESKAGWAPTRESFRQFLKWLDDGEVPSVEGESYLRMRDRLIAYFDRRNCLNPDELADETLSRAARRLSEEGHIETESPAKYCYTLARFVLLEHLRSGRTREVPLDPIRHENHSISRATEPGDEHGTRETALSCLEECTTKLDAADREIILDYYRGERREKIDNRRRIAERLGITVNALSIRACRIRNRLQQCVKRCMGGGGVK